MDKKVIKKITDLKVWGKAHELTLSIYKITKNFPEQEKYGLISQMRRCSVSVPSNIAEGFKRRGRDKFNFYYYAEASLEELKYQILLSYDLKYLFKDDYHKLRDLANKTGRMLNGWIQALK